MLGSRKKTLSWCLFFLFSFHFSGLMPPSVWFQCVFRNSVMCNICTISFFPFIENRFLYNTSRLVFPPSTTHCFSYAPLPSISTHFLSLENELQLEKISKSLTLKNFGYYNYSLEILTT